VDKTLQITEFLTVTGQVQLEQLKQAAQEEFKSVLNLRSPDELGFLKDEQQLAEALGLHYANIPFKLESLDEALITQILRKLEQLPKPVVIHCAAGMRSAAIALLSTAIQEGLTPEQALARARSLGFHYVDSTLISPYLRECFVNYILRHAKVAVTAA
jgi:uncharacterized protein (TIGR01244 family)